MTAESPPKSQWLVRVREIKLQRGCEDERCAGYPRGVPRALTFDPRLGTEKLFEISQGIRGKVRTGRHVRPGTGGDETTLRKVTWNDILAEIEKCDVVCKNCHEVRNTWTAPDLLTGNRAEILSTISLS